MSSLTMVGLKWNVLYYSTHSNPYRNMGPYIIRRAEATFGRKRASGAPLTGKKNSTI